MAENALDHLRPSADIRKVCGKVRANFTCAAPPAPAHDPADLVPLAIREMTGMFEVIREAIGLGALPPVPPLPELPEHVATPEVVHRTLPPEADELDQQGYLTLTQIQEFFGDEPPVR